ncbi:DMT family transporter [Mangrovibacterium lignilyticum]|uniref:DMT family transporter n=1 Tax=Mangrovibacterium lignilyticum TaxID=2668052 RepID=UPI0013D2C7A8|nr:DMT family transporter [Mangrovibacterium lignilyticum]
MSPNIKGIVFSLSSVFMFALMAILVRMIPHVPPYQSSFVRFTIGLAIIGILAMFKLIPLKFRDRKNLFLRGLIGGIAVYLFYLSIVRLGIGKGSAYVYSYPVFATLLSMVMLKEKVEGIKFIPIICSIGGLVLLSTGHVNGSAISFGWNEIIAISASITTALAVVYVKKLHNSDNSYAIFFAQSIIGFWLFLIPSGLTQGQGNSFDLTILIILAFVATIGQLFMTEGYRYVNVATGSLFQSMVPVLNLLAGYYIFHEEFSSTETLGAFIIIISCISLVFINYHKGRRSRIFKLVE